MIPKNILDKIVDIKLQDDDTPNGGIAFAGETVLDFLLSIDECDVEDMNTVDDLNIALKECGIEPIKVDVAVTYDEMKIKIETAMESK